MVQNWRKVLVILQPELHLCTKMQLQILPGCKCWSTIQLQPKWHLHVEWGSNVLFFTSSSQNSLGWLGLVSTVKQSHKSQRCSGRWKKAFDSPQTLAGTRGQRIRPFISNKIRRETFGDSGAEHHNEVLFYCKREKT